MAYKTSYELHHHFPRLAEESGFTFNTHRPRVHIDWNKIRLIDIDNLIRERKFVLIEQHLNDVPLIFITGFRNTAFSYSTKTGFGPLMFPLFHPIIPTRNTPQIIKIMMKFVRPAVYAVVCLSILDCVLESEFDVRILDEGVMKMFRLAQLAVEYQQFCRHYLDRSVYVLREEITSLAQELDNSKKQLQEKEEELRKLRKRSRHTFKSPLPYGNDNIAAMILKTLSNKGNIFPSASNTDAQFNKCNYCEKVFLNQLYLQSHLSRRHGDILETPQKEKQPEANDEHTKMNAEIMELKGKLKEMEQIIVNTNNQTNKLSAQETEIKPVNIENKEVERKVKDAEVSTNNEEYLLDKFEQWKKQEHEKYDKEIKMLRTQILETITAIKDKHVQPPELKDSSVIEQLHSTLVQQGAELLALKQELFNSKNKSNVKENTESNKEAEAQISFWTKRAEEQSKQYDALLQMLNEVARDAKQSRALAESERERAAELQALLQQTIQRKAYDTAQRLPEDLLVHPQKPITIAHTTEIKKPANKTKQPTNRQTLENLHKKAQELLNIGSLGSTSSEASSSMEEDVEPPLRNSKLIENHLSTTNQPPAKAQNQKNQRISVNAKYNSKIELNTQTLKDKRNEETKNNPSNLLKPKVAKSKKDKLKTKLIKESATTISGSPVRVVRAKITEEVNSRLVSFGVDPLKSRLPQNVFQKQRMELQQLNEIKSKKIPSREKVRHSILAYLDANTEEVEKKIDEAREYVSPTKARKSFRSISSVISNVKSKALSLVKLNDNSKDKLRSVHTDVAKKAMNFLRTPPESTEQSPENLPSPNVKNRENVLNKPQRNEKNKFHHESIAEVMNGKITTIHKRAKGPKTDVLKYDSDDDSNESDHVYNATAVIISETSKSVENLIKSPARRPASADRNMENPVRKYTIENGDLFLRSQSAVNLSEIVQPMTMTNKASLNDGHSSDDIDSFSDPPVKKVHSDETLQNNKRTTKGVLKNASSTSSLNKKKVIFDMDAIQMKSVSASPSQSLTEKSDGNDKYELGLVNLDGEEWDISSIENEPLKNDTKIQLDTRASPKIAELKKTIESQLARRNNTPSTAIVGGVDILPGPNIVRAPSTGGSNTSLGSSILDDSDAIPAVNHKAFVKPRKVTEKDDSELDISEFSIDGITVTNKNESF